MDTFCISQKIMKTMAYAFTIVLVNWAIIKEDLGGFSSKSEPSRVVFGMHSIRKFYKISS